MRKLIRVIIITLLSIGALISLILAMKNINNYINLKDAKYGAMHILSLLSMFSYLFIIGKYVEHIEKKNDSENKA